MKVKIITNTVVNGVAFNAGETVEVSESDCRLLVAMGRAEPLSGPAPVIEETVDTRTKEALNAAQARDSRAARK